MRVIALSMNFSGFLWPRADISVQAFHLASGDGFHNRFNEWSPFFQQGDAHLFDKIPPLGFLTCTDKLVLGLGENAF